MHGMRAAQSAADRFLSPHRRCSVLRAALAAACLLGQPFVTAQLSWTNSATLTVLQSNSHVVLRAEFSTTDGAFNLLQADRLDRLHLPPCACQISNQIYDLNWVPDSREIEWTLSDLPDSKPRFFRLLLEPVLSRGRVLVFPNGPIDWSQPLDWEHPTYVQPTEVWVDNLGSYDPEGNLTGSNEGTDRKSVV